MSGPERETDGRALGRGVRQSWRSLCRDPDYVADWRANAGRPGREGPPFPFRRQTEADLKAARWNLLAWEDPHDPLRASPFWADVPVLDARMVPAGDVGGYRLSDVARRTGARFQGLRLLDGTLIVKFVWGRKTTLFRVVDGDAFDPAGSGLAIMCTDGDAGDGGRCASASPTVLAMAKAAEIRGPAGDWHALRANPDYQADWRAHGGVPEVVESAGFVLRTQTEADLEAARWGLLAWEDSRQRSKFKPFWIDEKMLGGAFVEPGESVPAVTKLVRATGMNVSGLRLLDGALVLKVQRGRRVEQIRVSEGAFFDMERTALEVRYPFDGLPPTAAPRLRNYAAMMTVR